LRFNRWVRRFMRREESECLFDTYVWPATLEVSAYAAFESMCADSEVEVTDLFDLSDDSPFTGPEKIGVTRVPLTVADGRRRVFLMRAFALIRHANLGGIPLALSLDRTEEEVRISIGLRQDDAEYRDAIKAWVADRGRRNDPLRGNTVSVGSGGLEFLPRQEVEVDDVLLKPEVLDLLRRSFDFLRNPEGWPPELQRRAVLLAGAPGLGKSLAARWLAAELNTTTVWLSAGSLLEIPPGVLFGWLRRLRPVLVVLEDFAVAMGGGAGRVGDFLGEMDGFTDLEGIGILATTNDLDGLDPALDPRVRPGRFHRLIELKPPDFSLREALIHRRCSTAPECLHPSNAAVASMAEISAGLTGAQVAERVDEALSRVLWEDLQGRGPDVDRVFLEVFEEGSSSIVAGFTAGSRSA